MNWTEHCYLSSFKLDRLLSYMHAEINCVSSRFVCSATDSLKSNHSINNWNVWRKKNSCLIWKMYNSFVHSTCNLFTGWWMTHEKKEWENLYQICILIETKDHIFVHLTVEKVALQLNYWGVFLDSNSIYKTKWIFGIISHFTSFFSWA